MTKVTKNPYEEKWGGYGRVSGRDAVRLLDDNDMEIGDYVKTPENQSVYAKSLKELGVYLPPPDEAKVRFVVRWAPPVSKVEDQHLQLLLAGDWAEKARKLELLQFRTTNGKLPLESGKVTLNLAYWTAYGTVIIDEVTIDGRKKLYSRVKFKHKTTKEKVGVFWCWPYQQNEIAKADKK